MRVRVRVRVSERLPLHPRASELAAEQPPSWHHGRGVLVPARASGAVEVAEQRVRLQPLRDLHRQAARPARPGRAPPGVQRVHRTGLLERPQVGGLVGGVPCGGGGEDGGLWMGGRQVGSSSAQHGGGVQSCNRVNAPVFTAGWPGEACEGASDSPTSAARRSSCLCSSPAGRWSSLGSRRGDL